MWGCPVSCPLPGLQLISACLQATQLWSEEAEPGPSKGGRRVGQAAVGPAHHLPHPVSSLAHETCLGTSYVLDTASVLIECDKGCERV